MSKRQEEEETTYIELQITQHKNIHSYHKSILDDESSSVSLYERTDPNSHVNKDDPVVIKILDHYLNSDCQLNPPKGDPYTCGQCEHTLGWFKKECITEKMPHFSIRERLQKKVLAKAC